LTKVLWHEEVESGVIWVDDQSVVNGVGTYASLVRLVHVVRDAVLCMYVVIIISERGFIT